jgi:hypothetical protein
MVLVLAVTSGFLFSKTSILALGPILSYSMGTRVLSLGIK